jgi:Bacterial Ig-like domain (group 3)
MRRVGDGAAGSGVPSSAHAAFDRRCLSACLVVVSTVFAWALLAPAARADGVPTIVSPPTITGTSQDGQTLTEAHGSWTNQPTSYSYQWQRCSGVGGGCGAIAGATAQTYTLTPGDVGHTILVEETAHNASGASKPASSAPTAAVTPAPQPSPGSATQTVTTLVTSPTATVVNEAVTLIAAVTSSEVTVAPSGTVTFLNGASAIAGCAGEPVAPTGPSVVVTCQTWFAASTAQLTAVFAPSAGATMTSSVSPPVSLVIGRDATSTVLDVSKTVGIGTSTTYTAAVTPTQDRLGDMQPTGRVEFFDGAQPIASCQGQQMTHAGATCTVMYDSPGSHSITAQYAGDTNFRGSSALAQAMTVVKPLPRILGLITSTMQWNFYFTPTYTKVLTLVVNGASGATVTITCQSAGCPFARRATLVTRTGRCALQHPRTCATHGRLDLAPGFRDRRLGDGAQITVAITRRGWIGKSYRFTIHAGRPPRIQIACLAAGSARPRVGCTAGG